MMRVFKYFVVSFMAVALFFASESCKKRAQLPSNKYKVVDSTGIEMTKLNSVLSDVENEDINRYVKKSGLDFKTTSTGLRYCITKHGNGSSIGKTDKVVVDYDIKLVDGSVCYDYRGKNKQLVELGNIRHERGFVEALTMMKEGDEATFIAPSYMSYGALGNNDKIPPRASLVYEIKSVLVNK
jgi:FKBP-type peptidyl-prolyl cis-trans isomerase FkpA